MVMRSALDEPGSEEGTDMNKKSFNQRLVLECIVLVTEVIRLANEIIAFLNLTINYPIKNGAKVGDEV